MVNSATHRIELDEEDIGAEGSIELERELLEGPVLPGHLDGLNALDLPREKGRMRIEGLGNTNGFEGTKE